MNLTRLLLPLVCLMLAVPASVRPQTPFSLDSASSYLRTIAVDIGARPMGSPAEHRAMEFALAKFREFGIPETGLLPMRSTTRGMGDAVNTNSGTAYGILPGKTSRIIVLGGHIDSAGPDFPGANDDGSGSAAVIELARVLAQRENVSTIVFALFGGEEQGLKGSSHFVDTFPRIDDVVLMIQLDMTNGADVLIPLVDASGISAPPWLVAAAYEEAAQLGISALSYPTHFLTLNNALPGGGIGSDHMPFLRKGIPAIDFTSDVNDPIHTPQDTYEDFIAAGLKRSGDLAYRLVERFDGEVPDRSTGEYWLVQMGSTPLFVPPVLVAAFLIVSTVLGIVAVILLRRRRPDESVRATVPGLKLFLLLLIIQAFVWVSESVVEWIKGDRFPWYQDSTGFFFLAIAAAIFGIWVSGQLAPRLGLTADPYRYALRAVVVLLIILGITALGSLELAVYPAFALFFLSWAFIVRQPWVRLLLWLVSPYLMMRLFFSEAFGLLSRATTMIPPGATVELLYHGALILFFSLWTFPFILGFAAIRSDSTHPFLKLRWFSSKAGGLASASIIVALIVWLSISPSYSDIWQQQMTIHQSYVEGSLEGRMTVTSGEYLDGARIRWGGRDTLINARTTEVLLGEFAAPNTPWLRPERSIEASGDTPTRVSITLTLSSAYRPYTLSVQYRPLAGQMLDVSSPYVFSMDGSSLTMNWYSFPDTVLVIPISFTLVGSDTVEEIIRATFKEAMTPVSVEKALSTPVLETEVTATDTLALVLGKG